MGGEGGHRRAAEQEMLMVEEGENNRIEESQREGNQVQQRRRRGLLVASTALFTSGALLLFGALGSPAGQVEVSLFGEASRNLPGSLDVRWGFSECRGFQILNLPTNDISCPGTRPATLAAAVVSARACRASHGQWDPFLSPQLILDCYPEGAGCSNGTVTGAFQTLISHPAVDEICHPSRSDPGTGLGEAMGSRCTENTCHASVRYKIKQNSWQIARAQFSSDAKTLHTPTGAEVMDMDGEEAVPQSVEPLKAALLRGPALGRVNFYAASPIGIRPDPDAPPISPFRDSPYQLYSGPGSVLDPLSPDSVREVMVLGWGVNRDGYEYWVVADTIGQCYGDHGTFKIQMGINAGNFEGYGFEYADIDLDSALEDKASLTFLSGCSRTVEQSGPCLNSGIMSPNGCNCICPSRWTGKQCQTCNLNCKNGGVINDFMLTAHLYKVHKCRCDCPQGFSGRECEQKCPNDFDPMYASYT